MDERDLLRMQRDIEDLVLRVRVIENASSPYAQQLLTEFRELQRRVTEYAEQGTPVSRRELVHVQNRMDEMKVLIDKKADADDLAELKSTTSLKADADDIHDLKEETRSNRTMVRSALIAAGLSLTVGIILFFINRAVG
jgi:hypothetical protein